MPSCQTASFGHDLSLDRHCYPQERGIEYDIAIFLPRSCTVSAGKGLVGTISTIRDLFQSPVGKSMHTLLSLQ